MRVQGPNFGREALFEVLNNPLHSSLVKLDARNDYCTKGKVDFTRLHAVIVKRFHNPGFGHLAHRYPSHLRSTLTPIGEVLGALGHQAVVAPFAPRMFCHFALYLMILQDDALRLTCP